MSTDLKGLLDQLSAGLSPVTEPVATEDTIDRPGILRHDLKMAQTAVQELQTDRKQSKSHSHMPTVDIDLDAFLLCEMCFLCGMFKALTSYFFSSLSTVDSLSKALQDLSNTLQEQFSLRDRLSHEAGDLRQTISQQSDEVTRLATALMHAESAHQVRLFQTFFLSSKLFNSTCRITTEASSLHSINRY